MGVPIMVGDTPKTEVETGIYTFFEQNAIPVDRDYMKNNTRKGRRFSGGPTCNVRGVDVPCFIRWSSEGSMTSKILRDVCAEIDFLKVLD